MSQANKNFDWIYVKSQVCKYHKKYKLHMTEFNGSESTKYESTPMERIPCKKNQYEEFEWLIDIVEYVGEVYDHEVYISSCQIVVDRSYGTDIVYCVEMQFCKGPYKKVVEIKEECDRIFRSKQCIRFDVLQEALPMEYDIYLMVLQ